MMILPGFMHIGLVVNLLEHCRIPSLVMVLSTLWLKQMRYLSWCVAMETLSQVARKKVVMVIWRSYRLGFVFSSRRKKVVWLALASQTRRMLHRLKLRSSDRLFRMSSISCKTVSRLRKAYGLSAVCCRSLVSLMVRRFGVMVSVTMRMISRCCCVRVRNSKKVTVMRVFCCCQLTSRLFTQSLCS